jgi:SAM-dependent methyltransferase
VHGGARHAPARLAIDGVERRRIPVRVGGNEALNLHVVEVADWSWWEEQSVSESANPFGAKLWPASLAVADYLAGLPADVLPATTVLEIGCGNGLCSLTAAARGAASVVASDLSEDALTLTQEAAQPRARMAGRRRDPGHPGGARQGRHRREPDPPPGPTVAPEPAHQASEGVDPGGRPDVH